MAKPDSWRKSTWMLRRDKYLVVFDEVGYEDVNDEEDHRVDDSSLQELAHC